MQNFTDFALGQSGVNVDKSDLHIADEEVRQAQNAIRDPLGVEGGLKNRPGLVKFNSVAGNALVLGGISVPQLNLSSGGSRFFFVGKGSK